LFPRALRDSTLSESSAVAIEEFIVSINALVRCRIIDSAAFFGLVLATFDETMSLQSILAREAFTAESAGERLHREMYPLMPLEVVIPAERLRALVALERAFWLDGICGAVHHGRRSIAWHADPR
jgi:hypothetical protein